MSHEVNRLRVDLPPLGPGSAPGKQQGIVGMAGGVSCDTSLHIQKSHSGKFNRIEKKQTEKKEKEKAGVGKCQGVGKEGGRSHQDSHSEKGLPLPRDHDCKLEATLPREEESSARRLNPHISFRSHRWRT